MALGMMGYLGISAQNSFGTETASWMYAPIISESLTTNIEQLTEEGLRSRYEPGDTHAGALSVEGDIVFEPHPVLLGHFLRSVIGVPSSAETASGDAVYEHAFVPPQSDFCTKCALPPCVIEVYRGEGKAWQFTDCIVKTLAIEIAGGAIVKGTASILSRVSSLTDQASPDFPAGDPWVWDAASLQVAGVVNSDFESVTITIENPVEGVMVLDAGKRAGKFKRTGFRTVKVSGTLDFATQSEYAIYRVASEQAYIATLTGASLPVSYNSLKFDMPRVMYTTFPINIGGPGRISVGFEGDCKYSTTSAYSIRVTLTNTKESY